MIRPISPMMIGRACINTLTQLLHRALEPTRPGEILIIAHAAMTMMMILIMMMMMSMI